MARGTNNFGATYSNLEQAESAIRNLADNGMPIQHLSLVAQNIGAKNEVHGFVTSGDIAKSSARVGAWVGGLFGILSRAAFMWVPGFWSDDCYRHVVVLNSPNIPTSPSEIGC